MNTRPENHDDPRTEAPAPSDVSSPAAPTSEESSPPTPGTETPPAADPPPADTPHGAAVTEVVMEEAPAGPEPPATVTADQTEVPVPEGPATAAKDTASASDTVAEAEPTTEATSNTTAATAGAAKNTSAAAPPGKKSGTGEDAAATMAEAAKDDRVQSLPKPGKRLDVRLVQIGDQDSFVDWGGPSEGTIATAELKNAKGELRVKEGDTFPAIVRKSEETLVFTVGRSKGGDLLRMRELQTAHEAEIPVEGKIKSTNKGGFEVDLRGVRAFCPFSQIDTVYCDRPEDHVGQRYSFHIISFERGGRNIVLSRRRILEEQAKVIGAKTRETLEVGQVIEGKVRRLQPYGAFVDIGGIDGLVHVSQISHGHVNDPRSVLKVGQTVEVKVTGIEGLGSSKERISLSIKDLQEDPWDGAIEKWPVASTVEGKVVRLTEFGAFVELAPGVDGLVHVSEISSERIGHPSEVLQPGQDVQARVLSIDPENRRISLTLRPEGESPRERGGHREDVREYRPHERRGPRRDEPAVTHYVSSTEETEDDVDVSGMEFDDALELLKQKFGQD